MSNTLKLIVSLLLPQIAGGLGAIFTSSKIPGWYSSLIKPSLNPPSWIFGPVWTTLYLLMGVAAFLVWRKGIYSPGVKTALIIFAVQLLLNAAWSPLFFGAQNIGGALLEIIFMWFAILATILYFYPVSKLAALLLLPYLLWVSFATYLNYSLWRLN